MYNVKYTAMAIILSVTLFTSMILGPVAELNDDMHILEFGTSKHYISKQLGDDNKKIENAKKTFVKEKATKVAQTAAVSSKKVSQSAIRPGAQMSLDQQAIEIAEGTPLDPKAASALVKYAKLYDLNPSLILSVIAVESNFNQYEVGSSRDRGFMQIIPATEKWLAKGYGAELGLQYNPDRIFDPEYNIGLAAAYLNNLKEKHGDDYHRVLSEYNRGPGNLKKYFKKNRTYSTSYSRKVLSREKQYLVYNK